MDMQVLLVADEDLAGAFQDAWASARYAIMQAREAGQIDRADAALATAKRQLSLCDQLDAEIAARRGPGALEARTIALVNRLAGAVPRDSREREDWAEALIDIRFGCCNCGQLDHARAAEAVLFALQGQNSGT